MDYAQEPFSGIIPLNQIQGLGKRTKDEAEEITSDKTPAKKAAPKDTPQQKNGVTLTGEPADQVVINPDIPPLKESADSTAVMAFGRFNPPTTGHEKLIHKVESVATEHNGSAHVVASHSEGTSKNPLPQKAKVGYLKKIASSSTNVSGSSKAEPSIFHAASKLHAAGHKHLVVVAGSDRVKEYEDSLKKYNGVKGAHGHYNFKSIKVVSAGHRDPDAEGAEGMSGTKMRELAHAGKHKEFKAGLPKALHPHAEEIGNHVRSIKEETLEEALKVSSLDKWRAAASEREKKPDDVERKRKEAAAQGKENMSASIDRLAKRFEEVNVVEALSLRQRLGRGQRMRRNKTKLANARAIARKRLAKVKSMRRRALKRARSVVRQRIAGERGVNYNKLTASDKMAIDRLADKRKKQITRMATRLAPRVKRDEIKRLAAVASGKRISNSPTPLISSYQPTIMNNLTEKAAIALKHKATKAGISFDAIVEVFARGIQSYPSDTKLTAQQYAFSRVNSFLAKGKAFEEDKDLAERRNVKYTARDMVNTDVENLPKLHSFGQHQQLVADIKAEKDPIEASRKKAELVRRATGEMNRKIIEANVYTRVARKMVRAKSPQLAGLKTSIVTALKKKDYETLANIIMYLVRDKMGDNARIQQEQVCIPEEDHIYEEMSWEEWEKSLTEENNENRALNKPFRTSGGPKKFTVYVKNEKGNVIKLGFGDPNLEIKRDDPDRRKAYRARHGCDNPGPKWKANWWSCNWSWSANKKVGA